MFRSSARFWAARAFLNQYTTLFTSSGFRPRLDSKLFNSRTYCCICCRLGCWFSENHRCSFGNSNSGSKLVRILVFWVGYWLWTVCKAGCKWSGIELRVGERFLGPGDGYRRGLNGGGLGDTWALHQDSNLRRISSDGSWKLWGPGVLSCPLHIWANVTCNNEKHYEMKPVSCCY